MRHVLTTALVCGLLAVEAAAQQQLGSSPQQNPAAAVGLPTLGQLGQQAQPRSQPTSAFSEMLSQPVTTDVFAGRADPRAAQTQGTPGQPGGPMANRFGPTGFFGTRFGGGFRGAFGGGLGRGFGSTLGRQNMTLTRPAFVMRVAPVVAGMAPPPSVVRVGGTPPRRSIPPVVATLQRVGGVRTIEVEMQDGVAVLRGIVETAEAKRVAELIVRLEPGVRTVRNELQVVAAGTPQREPGTQR